jgi:flagellar basal-body rod protein FlgC
MSLLNILPLAGGAIAAQSQRLNTVASNLANADTVAGPDGSPYKARQVVFQATAPAAGHGPARAGASPGVAGVRVSDVVEDQTPGKRLFDPQHPSADAEGYVTHSNVNVVEEMVNMISASRSYQNNIEIMNTAQQLALKTLQLGQ